MVIAKQDIPDGVPKSGRVWKVKQRTRASAQLRTGLQKNLTKTYEERLLIKNRKQEVVNIERSMKEDAKQKRADALAKRAEKKKRLMEAEFKNTSYQAVSNWKDNSNYTKKLLKLINFFTRLTQKKLKL